MHPRLNGFHSNDLPALTRSSTRCLNSGVYLIGSPSGSRWPQSANPTPGTTGHIRVSTGTRTVQAASLNTNLGTDRDSMARKASGPPTESRRLPPRDTLLGLGACSHVLHVFGGTIVLRQPNNGSSQCLRSS